LDHTSLLKYLIDKWQLGPLGERTARARTFANALSGPPRPDTPRLISSVPSGLTPIPATPRQSLNDHQSALVALSHALESMAEEDPNVVAARSRQVISGPQSQIDAAFDRVEAFLSHAAALAGKAV
jgi:phospholipase C